MGTLRMLVAPAFVIAITGCGGAPQQDDDSRALAETGGEAAGTLEAALTSASLVANLQLGGGTSNRDAVKISVDALNLVFGSCLTVQAQPDPTVHIALAFRDGGCGIPFTKLKFAGAMTVDAAQDQAGATALDIVFQELHVVDVFVDGELHLKSGKEEFSYVAKNLTGGVGDHLVTLEGGGFAKLAATSIQFSGTGSVAYAGRAVGFSAEKVHRKFGDCYPDSGSITVWFAGVTPDPLKATLHFGGDDGVIRMDYKGVTSNVQLSPRSCK